MEAPSWWRWQEGRQGTGYHKLLLATSTWPIPFDVYLLRYRRGVRIPPHRDPVPGKCHYRANVAFGRFEGGEFVCERTLVRVGPVAVFRPDVEEHSVTEVTFGTRWVLSVGLVRPE